ncbi:MAG: response regulator transcription factor [Bacteroidetes bacterium]|nr:response regulator transcription factor [Bacteroidota bacterium]
MINILLIEDDKSFGYVLSEYMELKNYSVTWKETATGAINALSTTTFDLAILDVNLKNETGYDIARWMKDEAPSVPFIFLTARDLKIDQLKGYQLGAEEFITKPIDEEILLAKISVILSRYKTNPVSNDVLTWKDISLHSKKRELIVANKKHLLTERESLLMQALLSRPEELVPRKEILQNLWESQDEFSRNSMDVYISRLRKHLSSSMISIRNVHGKGFVLE